MVSAKITLGPMGPITFHGNGRRLSRGESIITTNPSEIRYFQQQQGFAVIVLEGKMSDVPAVEPSSSAKVVQPVATPIAKTEPKAQPKPQPSSKPAHAVDESDGIGDDDVEDTLDADALSAMTKSQLVIYGKEHGLKVSIESTKAALIRTILGATELQDDSEE